MDTVLGYRRCDGKMSSRQNNTTTVCNNKETYINLYREL